jgi:hypothetical protein
MSNLTRKTKAQYGIQKYLEKEGFKPSNKTIGKLTAAFLKSVNEPYVKYNPNYKGLFTAGVCNAERVQARFAEFKEYIQTVKQNML